MHPNKTAVASALPQGNLLEIALIGFKDQRWQSWMNLSIRQQVDPESEIIF
jgi:hypothetical protein